MPRTLPPDQHTKEAPRSAGWTLLEETDWACRLRTFTGRDGKPYTVYADDWSVAPVSVKQYALADLDVDVDWENVHRNTVLEWASTQDALASPEWERLFDYATADQIRTDLRRMYDY